MMDMDQLRRRVEAAERRLRATDDSRRQYSERLLTLVGALEQEKRQMQAKLSEQDALLVRVRDEHEQLGATLDSLLRATEAFNGERRTAVFRELDTKLTALTNDEPAPTVASAEVA